MGRDNLGFGSWVHAIEWHTRGGGVFWTENRKPSHRDSVFVSDM